MLALPSEGSGKGNLKKKKKKRMFLELQHWGDRSVDKVIPIGNMRTLV